MVIYTNDGLEHGWTYIVMLTLVHMLLAGGNFLLILSALKAVGTVDYYMTSEDTYMTSQGI